ncbi:hypothetical protein EST38_g7892 [Candolleomyces aberdarensis]|uniref:2OGFeDO JBP1/TET oxygenase domain-containing protein n=1 Tax=Candolleomyces aberdarensis TaxID=2316362 RepID=A0A4Q2DGT0_9AGAR|nr:hypothetical protein EST38_g7892 [Candolleomyces aberdarensis]
MVAQFLQAWRNPDYAIDNIPKSKIENPGELLFTSKPTIYIDQVDKVAAWYFPRAFTERRNTMVFDHTRVITQRHPNLIRIRPNSEHWRDDLTLYSDPAACYIQPGHANFSVCWYAQGHGPGTGIPGPSASLSRTGSPGGLEYLEWLTVTNSLIGVLLALVHPELYDLQMQVLQELYVGDVDVSDRKLLLEVFEHWATPFSAFGVITNRETPLHRDSMGGKFLFDMVATFGRYRQGRFIIPLLNSRFAYNPGAAIVFPGHLMAHGASVVEGERVCLASYMRPNVGKGALKNYREVPPPSVTHLAQFHGLW